MAEKPQYMNYTFQTTWTQKQLQDLVELNYKEGFRTGYNRGWLHASMTTALISSVIWGVITGLMHR